MIAGSTSSSGVSMGWNDFGLKTNPFPGRQSDATAPEGFTQKEVFALCDQASALQVFTGITGVGKTMHAKLLAKHFLKNKRRPTQLITASKTIKASGLLKMICCRFNIELPPGDAVDALKIDTVRRMIQKRKESIALIIDDAQNLSQESLSAVVRLSSLQQDPVKLQLVLFGLPIVLDRCRSQWDELGIKGDFSQGLIRSWGSDQTESYIVARLKDSGLQNYRRICRETCKQIHQLSGGVPVQINRRANMMLDQLIKGHASKASSVPLSGSLLWMIALISAASAGYFCIRSLQTPYAETPEWVDVQSASQAVVAEKAIDSVDRMLVSASTEDDMDFVAMDNAAIELAAVDPVLEAVSLLDDSAVAVSDESAPSMEMVQKDIDMSVAEEATISKVSSETSREDFSNNLESWLGHDGFTVQVMATSDENEANAAARKYENAHVVHAARQDKETFLVLVGDYSSIGEAKTLVNEMTESDSSAHPWVRQLSQLRTDVQKLHEIEETLE